MEIEFRFFATFREAVGEKTFSRTVEDDATVGDVLGTLEAEFEELDGQFLADGEIRDQVNVMRNDRNVIHEEGVDTELADGDTLAVFPPVEGG